MSSTRRFRSLAISLLTLMTLAAGLVVASSSVRADTAAVDTPTIELSRSVLGLDGGTITVSGSGFDPLANVSTRRPVTPGQPAGVYVVFGDFQDVWKQSEEAPSSARTVLSQRWAIPEPSKTQVATDFPQQAAQLVDLNEDGTFQVELKVAPSEEATGNYGIYTYAASGAANPAQETYTPITFSDGGDDGSDPDTPTISGGELIWGVKESFRNYIKTWALGDIETLSPATQEVDNGVFHFPVEGDGAFEAVDSVDAQFGGGVHFTGHAGALDVTISNLRVVLDGSAGQLIADVDTGGDEFPGVVLADLDLSSVTPTASDDTVTFADVPAVLTAEGEVAFSNYEAGTELDPVTVVLDVEGADLSDLIDAPDDGGDDDDDGQDDGDEDEVGDDGDDGQGDDNDDGDDQNDVDDEETPGPGVVTGGELVWGIKASFRNYIVGRIANGEITMQDPATQEPDNGVFHFPVSDDGVFESVEAIEAGFDGGVHLFGHGGELDVTINDVQVAIDGTSGQLIADVRANEKDSAEPPSEHQDVVLADLDLSGVSPTAAGDTVTLADVPAVLTADGEVAFSGFYHEGDELDPVTIVLDVEGADLGDLDETPGGDDTDADKVGCVASTVAAGESIDVCGSGFLPGEQVQVVLHSTPTALSVLIADASGSVSGSVVIPAATEAGTHHIELLGVTSGRSIMSDPITVSAAGVSGVRGPLPRTGTDSVGVAGVGVLVLAAGAAMVGTSRFRRSRYTTAA